MSSSQDWLSAYHHQKPEVIPFPSTSSREKSMGEVMTTPIRTPLPMGSKSPPQADTHLSSKPKGNNDTRMLSPIVVPLSEFGLGDEVQPPQAMYPLGIPDIFPAEDLGMAEAFPGEDLDKTVLSMKIPEMLLNHKPGSPPTVPPKLPDANPMDIEALQQIRQQAQTTRPASTTQEETKPQAKDSYDALLMQLVVENPSRQTVSDDLPLKAPATPSSQAGSRHTLDGQQITRSSPESHKPVQQNHEETLRDDNIPFEAVRNSLGISGRMEHRPGMYQRIQNLLRHNRLAFIGATAVLSVLMVLTVSFGGLLIYSLYQQSDLLQQLIREGAISQAAMLERVKQQTHTNHLAMMGIGAATSCSFVFFLVMFGQLFGIRKTR